MWLTAYLFWTEVLLYRINTQSNKYWNKGLSYAIWLSGNQINDRISQV